MPAIIWAKRSAARPSRIAFTIISAPVCTSSANFALANNTPPKAAQISTKGPLGLRVKTRITSATSNALPSAGAKGWFISLITAVVRQPAALAVFVSAFAKPRACAMSFIKAPLPVLTSKTKPSKPPANFLERIEAVIRSMLSTVDVTSRTAYKRLSAGAIDALAPTMAQPALLTTSRNLRSLSCVLTPGMDSNLSNVPPVWPKPRPEIIGTNAPQAAKAGANNRLTQSPTPPVECLSKIGPSSFHDITVPLSRIAIVSATRPTSPRPFRQTAIANAPACASLTVSSANPCANHDSSWRFGVWRCLSFPITPRAVISFIAVILSKTRHQRHQAKARPCGSLVLRLS